MTNYPSSKSALSETCLVIVFTSLNPSSRTTPFSDHWNMSLYFSMSLNPSLTKKTHPTPFQTTCSFTFPCHWISPPPRFFFFFRLRPLFLKRVPLLYHLSLNARGPPLFSDRSFKNLFPITICHWMPHRGPPLFSDRSFSNVFLYFTICHWKP